MKTSDRRIIVDPDGFRLNGMDASVVKWSAIRRITTHKLDLLTTDEIRLVIEHDGAGVPTEVSEEQPGFENLKKALEERFEFPCGWWEAVMKPAFATNRSTLFVRAEQGHAGDTRNARA
jgi:hypothetical protein